MSDYWGDEGQPVCPILEKSTREVYASTMGSTQDNFLRISWANGPLEHLGQGKYALKVVI